MTTAFLALALLAAPDSLETPAALAARSDLDGRRDLEDGGGVEDGSGVEDESGVEVRARVAPWALYSRDYGVGVGAGVGVRNVALRGSDLTLDALVQQHLQDARLAFFTSDPFASRFHVGVQASASTTERRRYFGLGPTTIGLDEVNLFHNTVRAQVRAGGYPLGTSALYVQPSVGGRYDYSSGLNAQDSRGTLAPLDPASRAAVAVAEGQDRYGLEVGLEVASDLLDRPAYPARGALVEVGHRRFAALDGSDLTTATTSAALTGYVPIRGRAVGIVRAVGVVTRSGDADGDGESDPVPFYYLPTLDNRLAPAYRPNRLTGRDVVAVGAGVRAPLFDVLGLYRLDGLAMVHVGNAYDDVFERLSPRVSLEPTGPDGRAGLRPALALGANVVHLRDRRVVVGGLVGFGPGGLQLAGLRLGYDLRGPWPVFR